MILFHESGKQEKKLERAEALRKLTLAVFSDEPVCGEGLVLDKLCTLY